MSASGPITVRFSEFVTEENSDFVELYDGVATLSTSLGIQGMWGLTGARLLGRFSGGELPGMVTTTGGELMVRFTSSSNGVNEGFTATLHTTVFVEGPLKLVGTVPATLGDLRCIGSIKRMDLSGQNLTGQLPDTITRLRSLSSMCAPLES